MLKRIDGRIKKSKISKAKINIVERSSSVKQGISKDTTLILGLWVVNVFTPGAIYLYST